MLERFSNILSWGGFLILVVTIASSLLDKFYFDRLTFVDPLFLAFVFYVIVATINYLIVGSFRLLPWRSSRSCRSDR